MVRRLQHSGLSVRDYQIDPPGGAQEGLSMLRSQGGVGLGSQPGKEEKEVVQLAEGDGDSCRGLEASGDLDI